MAFNDAMELIENAVQDAEDYQAHLEHNKESMKLIKIVERFLKDRKRLLYGGFAINALLPKKDQFYDPAKELPDFDFLSPDPYTDVAELIQRFTAAGYTEVEPAMGMHEGTYKVFVNYLGVADITFCDPIVYATLQKESLIVDSLHVCSPNYLRMNIFSELSHPAGDVSRWTKVYKRFLLLNKAHPFQECKQGSSASNMPQTSLSAGQKSRLYGAFLRCVQSTGDVVLGIPDAPHILTHPSGSASFRAKTLKRQIRGGPFLLSVLSNSPLETAETLLKSWSGSLKDLQIREVNGVGELLPNRVEIVQDNQEIPLFIAFQTMACHAYYDVAVGSRQLRIGSLDTLLYFYFAFHYSNLSYIGHTAIMCLCKELLELAYEARVSRKKAWPFPAFAVACLGYQPSLAELKREHRQRVKAEREKKQAEIRLRRSLKVATRRLTASKSKKKTRTRKIRIAK